MPISEKVALRERDKFVRQFEQDCADGKVQNRAEKKAEEEERRRIDEEAAAIYQKYMDNAKEEIAKSEAYLEKRTDRKFRDISVKQESSLIKLKAEYEQNRDRWVDEIVSRVIG